MAHERVGEGGLAGAVGAHDGVDLALADREVDPLEDLVLRGGGGGDVQVADLEVLVAHGRVGLLWWSRSGETARGRAARVRPRRELDQVRERDEVGEGRRFEGAG